MVLKMKESGFCAGVQAAINRANEQRNELDKGKKVYLYGDLVNNDHVMNEFKNTGYIVAKDIDAISSDSIVIIRAHGVSQQVYKALERRNIQIEDCTCPNVIKIHEIVKQRSSNGYKIIIIGKKGHPEVTGTYGWCIEGTASVAEKESDFYDLDLSGNICVVGQTTCKREWWNSAIEFILARNRTAEIYDTLCRVTSLREQKAVNIAKKSDTMIVVGDEKSANSLELRDVCINVCKDMFFVSSLAGLINSENAMNTIKKSSVIGLAGSASTSADVIEDIYEYLTFMDIYCEAKKEIEEAVDDYNKKLLSCCADNTFIINALKSLFRQNEGGKRIRGMLIKLGEKISSSKQESNYLSIAISYELFQTSILIHDDIIDNNKIRRGKNTIHTDVSDQLKRYNTDISDANHFGNSMAICIGDYGFFIANRNLFEMKLENSVFRKVFELYSRILSITCEGQIMDVAFANENFYIPDHYDEYVRTVTQIYEYKTAWYTITGPIMLGAVSAGASDELLDILKSITIPLGIAYQIKDDLLDIYSCQDVIGKSPLGDIKEKKKTLMFGYAYKNASYEEQKKLDVSYGNKNANDYDLEIVRHIFENTGAKKYAECEILRLSTISRSFIDSPFINDYYKAVLGGLVSYLTARTF